MTTMIGRPGEGKQCFTVQLADVRDIEYVHARSLNIESGALVFSNGDVFNRELVCVYGAGGYTWAGPLLAKLCQLAGHHDLEDEDDD